VFAWLFFCFFESVLGPEVDPSPFPRLFLCSIGVFVNIILPPGSHVRTALCLSPLLLRPSRSEQIFFLKPLTRRLLPPGRPPSEARLVPIFFVDLAGFALRLVQTTFKRMPGSPLFSTLFFLPFFSQSAIGRLSRPHRLFSGEWRVFGMDILFLLLFDRAASFPRRLVYPTAWCPRASRSPTSTSVLYISLLVVFSSFFCFFRLLDRCLPPIWVRFLRHRPSPCHSPSEHNRRPDQHFLPTLSPSPLFFPDIPSLPPFCGPPQRCFLQ